MAEPRQCSDVLDVTSDTVVLGVKLLGAVGEDLPTIVARALTSTRVQQEIEKALKEIADEKLKNSFSPSFTEKEAKEAAQKVVVAGVTGAGQAALAAVKQTKEYKDLEASAKKLVDALKCSPVGIWVDENKTWLYIVAAGAVVAGGVAMYVTRSGDTVTQPILNVLGGKKVSFKPIGNLELGATDFNFVPSTQTIEAKVFAVAKWEKIEAKFTLTVKAVGGKVDTAGSGQVIIPVKPNLGLTAAGTFNTGKNDYSLAVGVDIGVGGGVKLNLFGGYGNPLANPAVGKPNVFQDLPPGPAGAGANQGLFLGGVIRGEF
jgi:hypothetical protein